MELVRACERPIARYSEGEGEGWRTGGLSLMGA